MSATPYEPLRAAPPFADQQERMGWLLRARRWARRTAESGRAMAASVMDTLADPDLLMNAVSRLREAALRAGRAIAVGMQRLGWPGGLATVTAFVTSATGRQLLDWAVRTISSALTSALSTLGSLVDRGLRSTGSVGSRTADWLGVTVAGLRRRFSPVAAAARWFARASHPSSPLGRLLGSLSRSYLLHRLLLVTVTNRWLRAVVEAVLVPAIADSALLVWLRRMVAEARIRAERLREQADVMADLHDDGSSTGDARFVAGHDVNDDPSNRAGRRAAQRKAKHAPQ